MQLASALRIRPGEVVAFVGGGGKTTAMFRLAQEWAAAGGRAITTTTTRIFAAQTSLAPAHLVAGTAPPGALEAALARTGHVLVTGEVDEAAGKSFGVAPEEVARLRGLPGQPLIIVEADGSRMRPLKAPAEHEPVIPAEATLVVPVVGADVFGAPVADERVHRPERVAALAGVALGAPATPEVVASVLTHPDGGLKAVPNAARVIPLINKVEEPPELDLARQAAARLLAHPRITAVVLGAVRRDPPVREVWGRVAGVVLAAGRSIRMGRSKQLLPWGDTTMLGAVVRRLQASGLAEIVVVTGHDRAAVEASLAEAGPVRFARNPDFADSEMARSLQVGLQHLPAGVLAAMVALADQPQLEPAVVEALAQRWRATQAPVVAPFFRGQRGHPLLFDRAAWPGLMALPAQANPRAFLQQAGAIERVEVESDTVLRDVDTPEDYAGEVRGASLV